MNINDNHKLQGKFQMSLSAEGNHNPHHGIRVEVTAIIIILILIIVVVFITIIITITYMTYNMW